ncbi:hypothetical protein [Mycobacterium sp. AT1]|uniref:hypothetical protein n=1 Tax=Mycobacterium sp. AT1 TaxID=1961706 RepID=UPI00114FD676|nr:hypothetical protein [Mycobacterium sp. AT1]
MSADGEYRGPRCQSCGGPAWQWRGSVHGYTCSACIARHLDATAARADAKVRKHRERLARNTFPSKTPDSSRVP